MSGGKLKSSLAAGKGFFALLRADLDLDFDLDAAEDFFSAAACFALTAGFAAGLVACGLTLAASGCG